jgi:hypothetical protein
MALLDPIIEAARDPAGRRELELRADDFRQRYHVTLWLNIHPLLKKAISARIQEIEKIPKEWQEKNRQRDDIADLLAETLLDHALEEKWSGDTIHDAMEAAALFACRKGRALQDYAVKLRAKHDRPLDEDEEAQNLLLWIARLCLSIGLELPNEIILILQAKDPATFARPRIRRWWRIGCMPDRALRDARARYEASDPRAGPRASPACRQSSRDDLSPVDDVASLTHAQHAPPAASTALITDRLEVAAA